MVGEVERAVFGVPDARLRAGFLPDVSASQCRFVQLARRLPDGPDHAEVAHAGPDGLLAALENFDFETLQGEGTGCCQADDACADDDGCFC